MIFKEHKIVSRSLIMLFLAFMIIGAVTFIVQAAGDHPEKAWQAYLINFLLFSAISQGGLLFSIVMNTTGARWSRMLSGVSESFAAFFPVSFVLFLILFIGKGPCFSLAGDQSPRKGSLAEPAVSVHTRFYRHIYSICIGICLSLSCAVVQAAARQRALPVFPACWAAAGGSSLRISANIAGE